MLPLALWILSFVAPDLTRLGHNEWAVREREHSRCDNVLLALLLPAWHEDAEVNHRVQELRRRNLKWLSGERLERIVYRDDFPAWVRVYFLSERSRVASREVFERLHATPYDGRRYLCWDVTDRYPLPPGWHCTFMRGSILPGEWERWCEFCDYHRLIAPEPREK